MLTRCADGEEFGIDHSTRLCEPHSYVEGYHSRGRGARVDLVRLKPAFRRRWWQSSLKGWTHRDLTDSETLHSSKHRTQASSVLRYIRVTKWWSCLERTELMAHSFTVKA